MARDGPLAAANSTWWPTRLPRGCGPGSGESPPAATVRLVSQASAPSATVTASVAVASSANPSTITRALLTSSVPTASCTTLPGTLVTSVLNSSTMNSSFASASRLASTPKSKITSPPSTNPPGSLRIAAAGSTRVGTTPAAVPPATCVPGAGGRRLAESPPLLTSATFAEPSSRNARPGGSSTRTRAEADEMFPSGTSDTIRWRTTSPIVARPPPVDSLVATTSSRRPKSAAGKSARATMRELSTPPTPVRSRAVGSAALVPGSPGRLVHVTVAAVRVVLPGRMVLETVPEIVAVMRRPASPPTSNAPPGRVRRVQPVRSLPTSSNAAAVTRPAVSVTATVGDATSDPAAANGRGQETATSWAVGDPALPVIATSKVTPSPTEPAAAAPAKRIVAATSSFGSMIRSGAETASTGSTRSAAVNRAVVEVVTASRAAATLRTIER